MICKQCKKKSQSGHKFCNKKCRKAWVKDHNMTKKQRERMYDLLNQGITGRGVFDCDGNIE